LMEEREVLRPLYHRVALLAKREGAGGAYLYQYGVFCAHGLFG
jgi:hypothetical protein